MSVTRQSIIDFIRANPDRVNPGSGMRGMKVYNNGKFRPGLATGQCEYFNWTGNPSCVIGNVLALAGYEDRDVNNASANHVFADLDIDFEDGDLSMFAVAIQR